MEVKTFTWTRDIHDIYDYETKDVVQQTLQLNQEQAFLVRNGSEIETITQTTQQPAVVGVYKNESDYYLSFSTCSLDQSGAIKSSEPGYLIVRHLRNPDNTSRGFKLRVGDIFKLGQLSFKVTEMACEQQKLALKEKSLLNAVRAEPDNVSEAECRICLEMSNTTSNPLLRVCKCKGSISNIHLECLRQLMFTKIKQCIKGSVQTYRWKNLRCDICHQAFSMKVSYDDQIKSLISLPRPQAPYIMLEAIGQDQIHILHLKTNEKLLIGRGKEADLNFNHATISRQHAFLTLDEQGSVRLHDCQSRFGTLVQINGPVKVQKSALLCQVGRTVMGFRLKEEMV